MSENNLTATCTKCNVPLVVEDANDDASKTSCPECGTDFGSWGEVKKQMKAMLADSFKDTPWITVT